MFAKTKDGSLRGVHFHLSVPSSLLRGGPGARRISFPRARDRPLPRRIDTPARTRPIAIARVSGGTRPLASLSHPRGAPRPARPGPWRRSSARPLVASSAATLVASQSAPPARKTHDGSRRARLRARGRAPQARRAHGGGRGGDGGVPEGGDEGAPAGGRQRAVRRADEEEHRQGGQHPGARRGSQREEAPGEGGLHGAVQHARGPRGGRERPRREGQGRRGRGERRTPSSPRRRAYANGDAVRRLAGLRQDHHPREVRRDHAKRGGSSPRSSARTPSAPARSTSSSRTRPRRGFRSTGRTPRRTPRRSPRRAWRGRREKNDLDHRFYTSGAPNRRTRCSRRCARSPSPSPRT